MILLRGNWVSLIWDLGIRAPVEWNGAQNTIWCIWCNLATNLWRSRFHFFASAERLAWQVGPKYAVFIACDDNYSIVDFFSMSVVKYNILHDHLLFCIFLFCMLFTKCDMCRDFVIVFSLDLSSQLFQCSCFLWLCKAKYGTLEVLIDCELVT